MNIESIKAKVKSVPPIVWFIVAGGVLAVVYLRSKGGGSASSTGIQGADSTVGGGGGGGSSGDTGTQDVTSIIDAITAQNAANTANTNSIIAAINAKGGGLQGNGAGPVQAVRKLIGYTAINKAKTPLYNSKGQVIGHLTKATTFTTATKVKINGKWFYKITSGAHKGQFIGASTHFTTFRPRYSSAVASHSPFKANLDFLRRRPVHDTSKNLMPHQLPVRPIADLPGPVIHRTHLPVRQAG